MTNFIPIFPLGIVVYPGESLNLHIFEPRYKQLISECHAGKKTFDVKDIVKILPHRYPFLLVDKILEIEPENYFAFSLRMRIDNTTKG